LSPPGTAGRVENERGDGRDGESRGYSRDHLGCLHVVLALIVNVDGLPLSDEKLDGDHTDVTTLETLMRLVERKYGQARRVWSVTGAS